MTVLKLLVVLLLTYVAIKIIAWCKRRRRLVEAIDRLPGPPLVSWAPLINHALVTVYIDSLKHQMGTFVIIYNIISNIHASFPDTGICRLWLGWKPVVILYSPENVEQVLSSTSVLNKADEYRVFEPWIGEGLVTSKRNKWRFRRKILTPAFHFSILADFLPIMNGEASKLVKKLNQLKYIRPTSSETGHDSLAEKRQQRQPNSSRKLSVNIAPLIALCTLDTICETAMGVNINCQDNDQTDYVRSLYELAETALSRVNRPWLWFDSIFYSTEAGRRFTEAKCSMHQFTTRVILERKGEWTRALDQIRCSKETKPTFEDIVGSQLFKRANKRLAFLDLMLYQHLVEQTMSIEDIREEVDTFMFAGHDTTAVSISWTLYMLGLHEDIQERAREEIDRIYELAGDQPQASEHDSGQSQEAADATHLATKLSLTDLSVDQLREMKYLDRVIKESLRLWPSIPFVARQMTEDLLVGEKYLVPEGATCMVFTHALHTNPKYFPKPELFDPDRFLPENMLGRHPFAYIPFSAGPRNCIGQRFAQMELKVILAKLLRNFRFKTHDHRDTLEIVGELVLRSRNGIHVQIIPRFF